VDRHSSTRGVDLVFGCFNVRSANNKIDDLLDVRREQQIDVLFLTETWHDSDSVCIRRLRADGLQVIERARPRRCTNTMLTNHGGVAAAAVPGVRLTQLELGVKPSSFECICGRIASGSSACVVLVIYRPGSEAVSSTFWCELSDVFDRLVTYVDPVFVVGDVNVHLEDPIAACRFNDLLAGYGFVSRVSTATHDLGHVLDTVATRTDLPPPTVDVLDVGLSDHRLLRWSAPLARPAPVYTSVSRRRWHALDRSVFRVAIQKSPLCDPESWSDVDVDGLVRMYDRELTAILDRLIPARTVRCRRRASDPWFDEYCRSAKRSVRLFERRARRADPDDVAKATAAWKERRRAYRDLLRSKREAFWRSKVDAERSTPRQLWRSIDVLMGRGHAPTPPAVDADDIHRFFDEKVAGVRASTADAPTPSFSTVPPGCSLTDFKLLAVDDVIAAVRALPDKQCSSDPLPTSLLKENIEVLAPFLVVLFNRSLALGVFPTPFKAAYITPLLKKADLDAADVRSYRPISNLSVLSKLLERLVARQLIEYLTMFNLLPELQSAYRTHHSTETAVLKVLGDILRAIDSGDLAVLTLLDLSAAFDTVDHSILLRRLRTSYGLDGSVYDWFASYLDGRTQYVRCGAKSSTTSSVSSGVPQGSVLGTIMFVQYTADLPQMIERHNLRPHLYADDTQIYGFCRPADTAGLQSRVSSCVSEVASWMRENRLQLNTAKTEVLWCSSSRRQHQIPGTPLTVGTDAVAPVRSVRNLGIYMDSDVSMRTHVAKTLSSCFSALRQIRSIRRSVSRPVLLSLVVSMVLTRLDYGSATLAGLPGQLLDKLQSVLNAAARLVCSGRKYDHITPLLRDLHWLPFPERITFRLAVLAYRCQHGLAPSYLSNELHRVADVDSRQRLRSADTAELLVPRTKLSTVGDRAFPVAAARAWNDLPSSVTSAPSLSAFKCRLKTALFTRCLQV
jgi:hypothetical protein